MLDNRYQNEQIRIKPSKQYCLEPELPWRVGVEILTPQTLATTGFAAFLSLFLYDLITLHSGRIILCAKSVEGKADNFYRFQLLCF